MDETVENATDDDLVALAEQSLDEDDPVTALEYCETVLDRNPDHVAALFLAGEACREIGSFEDSAACYQRVIDLTPQCAEAWSSLGSIYFDFLDFEQARRHSLRAIRLNPHNPEAHYTRGMLRERSGDHRGAQRDFHRANLLDPENYPKPVPLADAEIDEIVNQAVADLDEATRTFLAQVVVLVEDFPAEEVCMGFTPPAPPGEILGYFSGVPITERSLGIPWTNLPSALVLYRKNMERIAWDKKRVIEELRLTVFFEIGHFLGLAPDSAIIDEE